MMEVVDSHTQPAGFIRRYLFSTDHKVIAKQYLLLSLTMALIGGFTSYLIRWQLAWPETDIPGWGPIGPDNYNAIITMHGTVMVFFVAMPLLLGAFGNYLIPLMIGANDMAFPRLNMMSFWTLFIASVVLTTSMFVPGGPAAAGWTSYTPLSDNPIYTGVNWGQNLWILAVALEFGILSDGRYQLPHDDAEHAGARNDLLRLPLLVWMEITAAVVFLLSVGPLIAGALMLLMDRTLGTSFFRPDGGGDPLMWEHLFWFFGHPEVYVVALPGFGIMLEDNAGVRTQADFRLPHDDLVDDRGRAAELRRVGASYVRERDGSAAGDSVQRHDHPDFSAVRDPGVRDDCDLVARRDRSFDADAVRAGRSCDFHHRRSDRNFPGLCFTDIFLHGTYFVVAHFHYTLFPVTFFGGFAGIYYWFPKMFGKMINETLGKIHFFFTFVCFNCVFIPLFLAGLKGNPRRIYELSSYEFLQSVQYLHVIATIAAIGLLIGQLPFVINLVYSLARGEKAEANPWRANTLEWATDSPPPHENFRTMPIVYRDPYEYSVPGAPSDWIPQTEPPEPIYPVSAAAD